MLAEFAGLLLMQLDLTVEAKHLDTFLRNFPRETYADVLHFPEPCRPFVSRDVLVESFIEGVPFIQWAQTTKPSQVRVTRKSIARGGRLHFASSVPHLISAQTASILAHPYPSLPRPPLPTALTPSQEVRQKVCYQGIDAVVKMIFIDNFVHGDLHPGNIFVTVDEATGEDNVVFLDAGIAVSYSQADHQHLIDVLTAFIQYDGYYGGQLMAEQTENPDALRDVPGFCETIQRMVEMARDCPSFFDQLGECISIICQAACDHHVKMKASFISIALSVKVVEGAVIQVDRDAVVAPRAKPIVVREHMKRKGRAMLGRSLSTGYLLNNDNNEQEDALIKGARERAAAGLSNHPKHRQNQNQKDQQRP